jgi:hypothetical protein
LSDLVAGFDELEEKEVAGRLCLAAPQAGRLIVPRHPTEDPDFDYVSTALGDVLAGAVDAGFPVDGGAVHLERATVFDMLRRPAWVVEGAFAGGTHA